MRLFRFCVLGLAMLAGIGCQEQDLSPTTATIPPLAFVRYINGVPDTLNTTLRWVDQIEFSPNSFANVPFRGIGQGGYQGLEAGARRFKVFTYDPNLNSSAGSTGAVTAELLDTTFTFTAGKYYTLLHLGYARSGATPKQRMVIIEDNLPAVNATSVNVRGIHAALGAPNVDVFATARDTTTLTAGALAFSNVGLTNGVLGVSAYAARTPGAFSVQIAATGTTTSLLAGAAPAGLSAAETGADPVAGAQQAGSVLTAIVFPPSGYRTTARAYSSTDVSTRVADSVYAVGSSFEVLDSLTPTPAWAANRFAPTPLSYWTLTITPPACPAAVAGLTRCEPRPAAQTVRLSASGTRTLQTTESLAGWVRPAFADTVIVTASPLTTRVQYSRPRYIVTRFNSGIVFFPDRNPPRVTP